jgi:hypothetical protein
MRKEDQWNKQGEHGIHGEGSHKGTAYKLPITNQDTERRNFQGYQKSEPGKELMDEISGEGTTGKGNRGNYKDFKELKRHFK